MAKLVGFGDFLLRLGPKGYLRFVQAREFEVNYTGAEANVCVSLAVLGMDTEFVTRVPRNEIAEAGINELNRFGVETDHVAFGGERLGVYYIEKGASQRGSNVVYDRKHTAISECRYDDFDWDAIFSGATDFYITGITPALSKTIAPVCVEAVRTAKAKGLRVSCDLNYRRKLWTEEEARATMQALLPYLDVLIVNEEHADRILGVRARDGIMSERERYADIAGQISERYGIRAVAVTTRRGDSASENTCGGMLYTGGTAYFSREYRIHIVDRIGGGDAFTAGLLYGMMNGYDPQKTVEFAAAACCLKQTVELDFNLADANEVLRLMGGDGSGRVRR